MCKLRVQKSNNQISASHDRTDATGVDTEFDSLLAGPLVIIRINMCVFYRKNNVYMQHAFS